MIEWGGLDGLRTKVRNAKHRARRGLDGVEPNIVEITHLCIMHGAHTSIYYRNNEASPEAGRIEAMDSS
jgi:hypothetical protein